MELDVNEIGNVVYIKGKELGDNIIKAFRIHDNQLLISVNKNENPQILPEILISVGDEAIGLVQEIKFRACAKNLIPEIEVTVMAPEVWDGCEDLKCQSMAINSVNNLKKLLPFIIINEVDLDGNIVLVHGRDLSAIPVSMIHTNHIIANNNEATTITRRVSTVDVCLVEKRE